MEKFIIELPLTGEYLTTIRLTTGGLCALADFDADETEDYKVCVTESLLILKRNGYARARVTFAVVDEKLTCNVIGLDNSGCKEDDMENEISRALLCALIGDVQFVDGENGEMQSIAFEG